jgi:hypothetical protein
MQFVSPGITALVIKAVLMAMLDLKQICLVWWSNSSENNFKPSASG